MGRIPRYLDFEKHGAIDVLLFFDNNSLGSYHEFLKRYETDYDVRLTNIQEEMLMFISNKIANGKRLEELSLLKRMVAYQAGLTGKTALTDWYETYKTSNGIKVLTNYVKDDTISASIKYEDRFLNSSTLIALSKQPRTIDSKDVQQIYNAKKNGTRIYLFVRKNKDDNVSKEFYFLGEIQAIGDPLPVVMKETNKNAVEITYHLDVPVREDIYEYIIS